MSLPLKALFTSLALASVSGGSAHFFNRHNSNGPARRSLVSDLSFWQGQNIHPAFRTNYGSKYSNLLVGTGEGKPQTKPARNDSWWEWSFKNRYNPKEAKGGFAKLLSGPSSGSSVGRSLEDACSNAYKTDPSNIVSPETPISKTDIAKFREDQLWLYCSAAGHKPKTLNDVIDTKGRDQTNLRGKGGIWTNSIGDSHKEHLLAIYHPSNETSWAVLDKNFNLNRPTHGFFSQANGQTIKEKCSQAYSQLTTSPDPSIESKPTLSDLYKWCSIEGHNARIG